MNKNKKVIVFDMDGVLFDSTEVAEWYTASNYPSLTKEKQKELLSGNFHEEIKKLAHLRKIQSEEEKNALSVKYSQLKSNVPMYPGAKELLLDLHGKGYTLVLNTSAVNFTCIPMLQRAGVTSLFDFLATAEVSKSKVEKFKMTEERYGAKAADLLFITDTLGDIREAEIAGVPTIAVTWGAHDRSYFTREPHKNLIETVDTFEELRFLIK